MWKSSVDFPSDIARECWIFLSVSKQGNLPSLSLWILSFKHTSNNKRSIVKKIWDRSLLMTDAQEFPPCSWKCFFAEILVLSVFLHHVQLVQSNADRNVIMCLNWEIFVCQLPFKENVFLKWLYQLRYAAFKFITKYTFLAIFILLSDKRSRY